MTYVNFRKDLAVCSVNIIVVSGFSKKIQCYCRNNYISEKIIYAFIQKGIYAHMLKE